MTGDGLNDHSTQVTMTAQNALLYVLLLPVATSYYTVIIIASTHRTQHTKTSENCRSDRVIH